MRILPKHINKFICICTLLFALPFLTHATIINIIAVNDFHGRVTPFGKDPGIAKFSTAIKAQMRHHSNPILVWGGDNFQGSPMSNLTQGTIVTDFMKMLHVTASAVGNHEFDWGEDNLTRWQEEGDFPFLAANIYDNRTQQPVTWAKPYIIVEKAGLKIAFIGLATKATKYTTVPQNVENFDFKDAAQCTKHWIEYLKAGNDKMGKPDIIVVLTHIPTFQDYTTHKITGPKEFTDLAHVKGLDAIISAHSHNMIEGYYDHMPVVQAYAYGRAIARLTIITNPLHHIVRIIPSVDALYKEAKHVKPDPEAQAIYNTYKRKLPRSLFEVIGTAPETLKHVYVKSPESTFDTWITNAIQQDTKTQISFLNSGSVRGDLPKGSITRGNIQLLLPFPNNTYILQISGKDIRKVLEKHATKDLQFSGLKVVYDPQAPLGERVQSVHLSNGKPLKADQQYTVATNRFMLQGGDNYDFSSAKVIKSLKDTPQDIVIRAMQKQKIIRAPKNLYDLTLVEDTKHYQRAA